MPLKPWALYGLSVICFAVVFRTDSVGLGALCLLVALVSMVWATLLLMQSRIESRAQDPGSLVGPEELSRIRARAAAERARVAASQDAEGSAG